MKLNKQTMITLDADDKQCLVATAAILDEVLAGMDYEDVFAIGGDEYNADELETAMLFLNAFAQDGATPVIRKVFLKEETE